MVILLGGASHTGKTLLAKRIMERYGIPYLSLKHLKNGLIVGNEQCGFKALDSVATVGEKMWPVVQGIIDTVRDRKENIIIEGKYIPTSKAVWVKGEDVIKLYLIFSEEYINEKFDDILKYENVIGHRKYPENRTAQSYIEENALIKNRCEHNNLQYFVIDGDYEKSIDRVLEYIDGLMSK
jgi:putative acetyltransferase